MEVSYLQIEPNDSALQVKDVYLKNQEDGQSISLQVEVTGISENDSRWELIHRTYGHIPAPLNAYMCLYLLKKRHYSTMILIGFCKELGFLELGRAQGTRAEGGRCGVGPSIWGWREYHMFIYCLGHSDGRACSQISLSQYMQKGEFIYEIWLTNEFSNQAKVFVRVFNKGTSRCRILIVVLSHQSEQNPCWRLVSCVTSSTGCQQQYSSVLCQVVQVELTSLTWDAFETATVTVMATTLKQLAMFRENGELMDFVNTPFLVKDLIAHEVNGRPLIVAVSEEKAIAYLIRNNKIQEFKEFVDIDRVLLDGLPQSTSPSLIIVYNCSTSENPNIYISDMKSVTFDYKAIKQLCQHEDGDAKGAVNQPFVKCLEWRMQTEELQVKKRMQSLNLKKNLLKTVLESLGEAKQKCQSSLRRDLVPIVTPKSSVPMQHCSSEPQTALRFGTVWMRRTGLDIVIGVKCENISSDRYASDIKLLAIPKFLSNEALFKEGRCSVFRCKGNLNESLPLHHSCVSPKGSAYVTVSLKAECVNLSFVVVAEWMENTNIGALAMSHSDAIHHSRHLDGSDIDSSMAGVNLLAKTSSLQYWDGTLEFDCQDERVYDIIAHITAGYIYKLNITSLYSNLYTIHQNILQASLVLPDNFHVYTSTKEGSTQDLGIPKEHIYKETILGTSAQLHLNVINQELVKCTVLLSHRLHYPTYLVELFKKAVKVETDVLFTEDTYL